MIKLQEAVKEINKIIVGKEDVIDKLVLALLSGGHVLIDDIPGVGKTTLSLAISKVFGLDYRRMQFTPDVLPSDITGFTTLDRKTDTFVYQPGAIMCNLFLADEINRTSSRTQSALLEVMEEGTVTVDGITHAVPDPFFVIATENPIGSIGTQLLPDSQLDRFTICLSIGYPDTRSQIDILKSRQMINPLDQVQTIVTKEELAHYMEEVTKVQVSDELLEYMTVIAEATRKHPLVSLGISPRGIFALCKIAKASAFYHDRDYVVPDDIHNVLLDVFAHRMILKPQAKIDNMDARQILTEILSTVKRSQV